MVQYATFLSFSENTITIKKVIVSDFGNTTILKKFAVAPLQSAQNINAKTLCFIGIAEKITMQAICTVENGISIILNSLVNVSNSAVIKSIFNGINTNYDGDVLTLKSIFIGNTQKATGIFYKTIAVIMQSIALRKRIDSQAQNLSIITQKITSQVFAATSTIKKTFNDFFSVPAQSFDDDSITPIIIPKQTVYQMQHTLIAKVNNLQIDINNIQISLNADAWAWNFSCHLVNPEQLSLFDSNDEIITISIENYDFDFLVEDKKHNQEFGKNEITLSGRSLTALLSTPYVVPKSGTQSTLLGVQQLIDKQLPFDWVFNWLCESWVIPAGAYSYNNQTTIQVITDVTSKIGAIVVPSRTGKNFTILPRYPILPWKFEQTTPNVIIPADAIISVTYRNAIPTQADSIYIQGSEIGGVLVHCILDGFAGDKTLPSMSNVLMTSTIAARSLAQRVLAGQYVQPKIQTLTIGLGGDIPLLEIGQLVRVDIDETPIFGIINSVSISADFDTVRQTIQIGEETQSVWTAFKDLLPSNPLQAGKLLATNGVTSELELHDKSKVRVRGTGTVDKSYYFRAGIIENEAPDLVLSEIVI